MLFILSQKINLIQSQALCAALIRKHFVNAHSPHMYKCWSVYINVMKKSADLNETGRLFIFICTCIGTNKNNQEKTWKTKQKSVKRWGETHAVINRKPVFIWLNFTHAFTDDNCISQLAYCFTYISTDVFLKIFSKDIDGMFPVGSNLEMLEWY